MSRHSRRLEGAISSSEARSGPGGSDRGSRRGSGSGIRKSAKTYGGGSKSQASGSGVTAPVNGGVSGRAGGLRKLGKDVSNGKEKGKGKGRARALPEEDSDEEQAHGTGQAPRHGSDDDDDDDGDDAAYDPDTGAGASGDRDVSETQTSATAQKGTVKGPDAVRRAKDAMGKEVYRRKVNDLVRMALFYEFRKQTVKREDISKKLLDKNSRLVNSLVEDANKVLRTQFGMELTEIRLRGRGDGSTPAATQTQKSRTNGRRGAAAATQASHTQAGGKATDTVEVDSQNSIKGAGSYVLRSTLPMELISLMNQPQQIPFPDNDSETLIQSDRDSARVNEYAIDRSTRNWDDCGALLDWKRGDGGAPGGGVGFIGLLFVVLGLIMVNDKGIAEDKLMAILSKNLELDWDTILPFASPDSASPPLTFEGFLSAMVKQGYLDKVKGNGVQRATDHQDLEWRWGPRADAEIGEKAVADFMADIMAERPRRADDSDDEADDGDAGVNRRRTQVNDSEEPNQAAKRRRLLGNITLAAGGNLGDITQHPRKTAATDNV